MSKFITVVKTEPALVTGVIQTVIALLAGTVVALSASQEAAILAVTTAILGLIAAAATRPFQVSALTALTGTIVTLLVGFGVPHVDPSIVATVNAAITAVASLIVRLHVTPVVLLPRPAPAPVTPPAPAPAPSPTPPPPAPPAS